MATETILVHTIMRKPLKAEPTLAEDTQTEHRLTKLTQTLPIVASYICLKYSICVQIFLRKHISQFVQIYIAQRIPNCKLQNGVMMHTTVTTAVQNSSIHLQASII